MMFLLGLLNHHSRMERSWHTSNVAFKFTALIVWSGLLRQQGLYMIILLQVGNRVDLEVT